MFGREKTSATPAGTPAALNTGSERVKEGGKGRATPTRREAEQRNRRPAIGAPAPPRGATRAERKVQRAAAASDRRRQQASRANGDEAYQLGRDKGPVRRYIRDYVDARLNLGELFLPVAVISILVGLYPVPAAKNLSVLVMYVMLLVVMVDSFVLWRRLKTVTQEKFGDKGTAGSGTYGVIRALQIRRFRMPKVQVARGQYPS